MTITVLAILFIIVVLVVAAFGYKLIIRQGRSQSDLNTQFCSLCRNAYNTSQLIERQVGDYKILYFCSACINKLHDELISKN